MKMELTNGMISDRDVQVAIIVDALFIKVLFEKYLEMKYNRPISKIEESIGEKEYKEIYLKTKKILENEDPSMDFTKFCLYRKFLHNKFAQELENADANARTH